MEIQLNNIYKRNPAEERSCRKPIKESFWRVVAIDIYGRIFLEDVKKSGPRHGVSFWDEKSFKENFTPADKKNNPAHNNETM